MYYKLSNRYSFDIIESEIGIKFRFPDLFEASPIVDGLNEEILPIVTSENSDRIEYGIWGILPDDFKEDWQDFQKIRNTLNIDLRSIDEKSDYQDALENRRCVVLVSGFFASYNFQGQIYPIYIYPKNAKLFSLAAIYNVTNDGFITFTLLLEKSNFEISKLQNISDSMPIVLNDEHKDIWLGEHFEDITLGKNDSFKDLDFSSHPIAKEFYKNNILYNSILDPVIYKEIINS